MKHSGGSSAAGKLIGAASAVKSGTYNYNNGGGEQQH
jgi:hypothetical protein